MQPSFSITNALSTPLPFIFLKFVTILQQRMVSRFEGSINSTDGPDLLKPIDLFHLIRLLPVEKNQDSFSELYLSNDPF